jgi:hypothetical protein
MFFETFKNFVLILWVFLLPVAFIQAHPNYEIIQVEPQTQTK